MTSDCVRKIISDTDWLTNEQDLTAGRLAILLRQKGIAVKSVICAKVFPDTKDPTSGVLVLPGPQIIQFAFNRAGMVVESAVIDEWINITQTYMDHPWRDDILAALMMIEKRGKEVRETKD